MQCFDAHSDILTDVTVRRLAGETDVLRRWHLPRLRRGGEEGAVFVIWVDPPYDVDHAARTRDIMRCAAAELAECPDVRVVRTLAEVEAAKKEGLFYVFLGIEGLAAIGEDVGKINDYYDFGCRHAILVWNEANALAAGANSGETYGLTAAGKKAARLVQDKGMVLDVSHLNEAGFWDVAKLATKPFIASHSNCKALCDVPRNLTDAQLRAIRDSGGVVGLNAYTIFTAPDPKEANVEGLARHAAHMIDVMGIDHVGCGFDFSEFLSAETASSMSDECTQLPGLWDASEVPNLFAALAKMGLRQDELEKIAFRNFHRVFRETVGC